MYDAVVQEPIDEAPDLVLLLDHLLRHEKHASLSVDAELPEHIDAADKSVLLADLTNLRGNWKEWKDSGNSQQMRAGLLSIAERGAKVRDQIGSLQPQETTREHMSAYSVPPHGALSPEGRGEERDGAMPENVAPLGRALFTDYLLPVELGGTLLLVATIGAIAISGRKPEVKA